HPASATIPSSMGSGVTPAGGPTSMNTTPNVTPPAPPTVDHLTSVPTSTEASERLPASAPERPTAPMPPAAAPVVFEDAHSGPATHIQTPETVPSMPSATGIPEKANEPIHSVPSTNSAPIVPSMDSPPSPQSMPVDRPTTPAITHDVPSGNGEGGP